MVSYFEQSRQNGPLKLRSDYRAAVLMKNRLHHESWEPIEEYNKNKKFSPKITSPALELPNIQDGNIGFDLQVPRGGTHLDGVGSELTFLFLESLFCYSWFRLQLIAIHCNRRGVWTDTPHTRVFLEHLHFAHTPHYGSRCLWCAFTLSACHPWCHMFERVVCSRFVFFLSLSRLYFSLTVYLFSGLLLNFHVVGTAED